MWRWRLLLIGLLLACVWSGVAIVQARQQSRDLFAELVRLQAHRDEMDVEWGRLQLEQSAWARHGRIEKLARGRLHMHIPRPDEVVIVRP